MSLKSRLDRLQKGRPTGDEIDWDALAHGRPCPWFEKLLEEAGPEPDECPIEAMIRKAGEPDELTPTPQEGDDDGR